MATKVDKITQTIRATVAMPTMRHRPLWVGSCLMDLYSPNGGFSTISRLTTPTKSDILYMSRLDGATMILTTLLAIVLTAAQGSLDLADRRQWERYPEREPYLRNLWGCADYEPTYDCAKRFEAEAKRQFFERNCDPSETFEGCQERFRAEALSLSREKQREALGCFNNEELAPCTDRVQAEAREAYRLWLHEQGINLEEAFAELTREERAAIEAAGLHPRGPPVFDEEAMRWYACRRIVRGEIPPPETRLSALTPNGEFRSINPCEYAFDPLHWRRPE